MKRILAAIAILVSCRAFALDVNSLKVNHMTAPAGITDPEPTFSWITESDSHNAGQIACRIQVFDGRKKVWNSGRIAGSNSVAVPYAGKQLKSGTVYEWRVRVWDNEGNKSAWSSRARFVTGLFNASEWQASWIEAPLTDASPLMRKEFSVSKKVKRALAFVTAHGLYEASLNGSKIGDAYLAPGYTSYDRHLQYQTYDVTDMIAEGENAFGLELARGWYLSNMGFVDPSVYKPNFEGTNIAALAQILITYQDGSKDVVVTDGSWKYSTGGILESTIYNGETFDAAKVQQGWNTPGFDDSQWQNVQEVEYGYDNLAPQDCEQVRTEQYVSPKELIETPAGELVIDFGQNLVGTEVLNFTGKPGQTIKISHAEYLDENGNFYTVNLRSAKALSTYICDGTPQEFSAKFTFYGFRYIKVEGMERDEINLADFKAAVRFSSLEPAGSFRCSDERVNRLQSNIQWSQRGNFVDIPSDCPQRDERLGWTGDAEVFARTATFNRQTYAFYSKWLKDLAAEQFPGGEVTDIVPFVKNLVGAGHVGWADAATIIPWTLYMAYGDTKVLETQYSSMKKWVDCVIAQSGESCLWNTGWHYGDWLSYVEAGEKDGFQIATPNPISQQCHFANSADIMARTAEVLGNSADAEYYAGICTKAKEAFCREYLNEDGSLTANTQTAYILALVYDMLPENVRAAAAARLAENVEYYGHLTTGFLGTPHINRVLTENGYNHLAYRLLFNDTCPSWLYPVTMDATTIWERWNSMLPDHTIPDNGMNSFNHYSYGAIGDWLYRYVAGISELEPGFKTIRIKPYPGEGLTFAEAEETTPYGKAASAWRIEDDGRFVLEITVPFNTRAEVCVPAAEGAVVTKDGEAMTDYEYAGGYAVFNTGSGRYVFEVK